MDESQMWKAIEGRDKNSDGVFFYGVKTTGIFCRPSCPSKTQKREATQFFASAITAREAGFRACKRCQPQKLAPALEQTLRVATLLQDEPTLTLGELSKHTRRDAKNLRHNFQGATGVSPREFGTAIKMETMQNELKEGKNVLQAQIEAGFGSSRGAYQAAEALGMTPATFGKGGAGTTIKFAVVPCELGWLLIAKTVKGVCAVRLGDDETQLEANLRSDFHAATVSRDGSGEFTEEIEHLLQLVRGQKPHRELPLDIQKTAFQWRVWLELMKVPAGQTATYGEIATRIGSPKAARAVGAACGQNPVALLVPCHRVIGKSGGLTGYEWGVSRKQKLLRNEISK